MTYIALLRGVNVGGRIIKMAELKDCLEKAGLTDVRTVLQSGNAVFESDQKPPRLKVMIEEALSSGFGFPAKVWVMTIEDLTAIIADNPFKDAPVNFHQYAIFFEDGLQKDFVTEARELSGKNVVLGRGVAYWKVEKGRTLDDPVGKILTRAKYKNFNTNRNINTLIKITG